MKSLDVLRDEHAAIQQMLVRLNHSADSVLAGRRLDEQRLSRVMRFIHGFNQRIHQAKEEALFRSLTPRAPELGALPDRHAEIRGFAQAMSRVLPAARRRDPAALRLLAENAKAYVGLIRRHMAWEQETFFPLAAQRLRAADDRALVELFAEIERAELHAAANAVPEAERLPGGPHDATAVARPGGLSAVEHYLRLLD